MTNAGDVSADQRNGELRVRVDAVERDVSHIENQVNAIRDAMATKADMATILSRIESLSAQQSASARPNYSLLVSIVGVAMVFLTMIGGFAYWPINTATGDLKLAIIGLAEKAVPQKQYEADQARVAALLSGLRADVQISIQQQRYNADQDRLNHTIEDLRIGTEQVRVRTFDFQGRVARNEESIKNLDSRFDTISRRLSEFIRDTGKH